MMPKLNNTVALTDAEKATILVFLKKLDPEPAGAPVTFDQDVAPILAKNCSSCHGDGKPLTQKLSLSEADLLAKADKVAEVITSEDRMKVMPPLANNRALTDDEKAAILAYVGPL
jgi:mono/diheme cytochrome c family protein